MKMNFAIPFVYVIVISTIFSCKKATEHKESFSGIVLHTITKQPLVNQKISFWVNTYTIGKKNPPEWPNGEPFFTSKQYLLTTDNNGRFTANFEVVGEWMFTAQLITGEYIQKVPLRNVGYFFPGNSMILAQVRDAYDTIYGEKPSYVKYQFNNTNDAYANDTLFVLTVYKNKWIRTSGSSQEFAGYNLIFAGQIVNYSFLDTIPAESEPNIPVKWVHKQSNLITQRNDMLLLQPNNVVEYSINY